MSVLATDDEIKAILNARSEPVAPLPTPPSPRPPSKKEAATSVAETGVPFKSEYTRLEFGTPLDLLRFVRTDVKPHAWQRESLEQLAGHFEGIKRPKAKVTSESPVYWNLVAANGSGKDAYVIAPFAVWFCVSKIRSRCIITSASYEQLKNQTFNFMVTLCEQINELLQMKIFNIVEFKITCTLTGSEIKCFVTDEAGKAEGYHPFPDWPGAEMAFIANEAKNIPDELWTAFARFTGYNYWIEISSPGACAGHFYKTSTAGSTIRHPDCPKPSRRFVRHVTCLECPHIPQAHIDELINEYGINSPLVRSSLFAEFSDFESYNVIKAFDYDKCFNNPPKARGKDIGIGLDVAGGGDENGCFVREGNRVIHKFFFVQKDTDLTADLIDLQLAPWKDGEYHFNADNGGLSQAIADKLSTKGWRITRRNNNSPPGNKRFFTNLGAQMYYKVKRLIERGLIILPSELECPKLRQQLTTRSCKGPESTQGRWALQSKPEARANGLPSPDRADAFVLCFDSLNTSTLPEEAPPKIFYTAEQIVTMVEDGKLVHKMMRIAVSTGNHTSMTANTTKI